MADSVVYETVITDEGDTVDLIAFRRFGVHGAEPDILAANAGLAARDAVLPAGLAIRIPIPVQKDRRQSTRLWS